MNSAYYLKYLKNPKVPDSQIGRKDRTWNVISGCQRISPGCDQCWAMFQAGIIRGKFGYPIDNPMAITFHEDKLPLPLSWVKPSKVIVTSMGDFFHEDVLSIWHDKAFDVMLQRPRHTFIICTKRPRNMMRYFNEKLSDLPSHRVRHIWFMVSAENQEWLDKRLDILMQLPEYLVRGVVLEPLLEPVHLGHWLDQLGWIVAGPETGLRRRGYDVEWFRSIKDECDGRVPFFLKQMHAKKGNKKIKNPFLDGKPWKQYPPAERVWEVTYKVNAVYKDHIRAESAKDAEKVEMDIASVQLVKETMMTHAILAGDKECTSATAVPWSKDEEEAFIRLCKKNEVYLSRRTLPMVWKKIADALNEEFGKGRSSVGVNRKYVKLQKADKL